MTIVDLTQLGIASVLLVGVIVNARERGGDMGDRIMEDFAILIFGALLAVDALVLLARHINWGGVFR